MKYETLHNVQIPKIGFGSARLGGKFVGAILADRSHDEFFLAALRSRRISVIPISTPLNFTAEVTPRN